MRMYLIICERTWRAPLHFELIFCYNLKSGKCVRCCAADCSLCCVLVYIIRSHSASESDLHLLSRSSQTRLWQKTAHMIAAVLWEIAGASSRTLHAQRGDMCGIDLCAQEAMSPNNSNPNHASQTQLVDTRDAQNRGIQFMSPASTHKRKGMEERA